MEFPVIFHHQAFMRQGAFTGIVATLDAAFVNFLSHVINATTVDNPFDTSACHDGMYIDDAQWETCMGQMLSDFKAFAFGYGYTSLVVELQDEEAVSCRDDVDDTGAWLISTNENKEACPYGKSADETLLIHQIKREDMWLETDLYQQYLSN